MTDRQVIELWLIAIAWGWLLVAVFFFNKGASDE